MADLLLAICTILGAGAYLRAATLLPEPAISDAVGPRAFPELIGAGLLLGGLLLMREAWRKRQLASPAVPVPFRPGAPLALAGLVAWTLLYDAAFEPAGYIVATLVYASGALFAFHRTRWYWNVLIAAGFTLAAWAVFTLGLGVVLPGGILPFGDAG